MHRQNSRSFGTDVPQPSDRIGAYTTEQLEQMNQEFTAAVERAFRSGDESDRPHLLPGSETMI
jgi:hypothetical protein